MLNPKLLPYGVFHTPDAFIIFDRQYRPIVKLAKRKGPTIRVRAHDQKRTPCEICLPLGAASRCAPTEWIEHDDQFWFYNDNNPPHRNRQTMATLAEIVGAIPVAATEIESRSH